MQARLVMDLVSVTRKMEVSCRVFKRDAIDEVGSRVGDMMLLVSLMHYSRKSRGVTLEL